MRSVRTKMGLLVGLATVALLAPVGLSPDRLAGAATSPNVAVAERGEPGAESSSWQSRGRRLFRRHCGSCHRLAAARTTGGVGPNLDKEAHEHGGRLKARKVRRQIRRPTGSMPAKIVKRRKARLVARYVAKVAGCR